MIVPGKIARSGARRFIALGRALTGSEAPPGASEQGSDTAGARVAPQRCPILPQIVKTTSASRRYDAWQSVQRFGPSQNAKSTDISTLDKPLTFLTSSYRASVMQVLLPIRNVTVSPH